MKLLLLLLITLFSINAFSQHTYSNPREKAKRSLLEEPQDNILTINESENKLFPANQGIHSTFSKGQIQFCACEKTYFLSLKRYKLREKLIKKGLMKNVYRQSSEFTNHKYKSNSAMKLIRGKYEIEEGFDCGHSDLSFRKISQYNKAIIGLVNQCDIEIITES